MHHRSKNSESCFAGILQNSSPNSLFEELASKHYGLDRKFSRNITSNPSIRRFCNVQPSDRVASCLACRQESLRTRLTEPAASGIPATVWQSSQLPGMPARELANPSDWARNRENKPSGKPPGFTHKPLVSIKNTPIQFFVLRWNYSGADRIAGDVYCSPEHI